MGIQGISSRPSATDTTATTTTQAPAAEGGVSSSNALKTSVADAPATTPHLSRAGLFLGLMQVYESKHPDEAKAFLQDVADKLHLDAQNAGHFGPSLAAWGDKFQKAAETGDLTGLLPSMRPPAHFGLRAYQQAAPTNDAAELDALIARSVLATVADAAEANGGVVSQLARASSQVTQSPLGGEPTLTPAQTQSASDAAWTVPLPLAAQAATGVNSPLTQHALDAARLSSSTHNALINDATSGRAPPPDGAGLPNPAQAENPDPTLAGAATRLTAPTPANFTRDALAAAISSAGVAVAGSSESTLGLPGAVLQPGVLAS